MFKSILIANRGECACRIIRTARQLGIRAIAVYAPSDADALHARLADIALPLPSYLDIAAIVECARQSAAEAVHPGYGFLSENPAFADALLRAGLVFVGPPPEVMTIAASKIRARQLAQKAGANVLPAMPVNAKTNHQTINKTISYPLMLKAAAGGGGRGMRIVENAADMKKMTESARREAKNAFGDDALLAEKYLPKARHLEVQILADKHKNILTLGERDCSMQRRHQKIIEESPAPSLNAKQRQQLHTIALNIAKAAGYENAGTAEFLFDESGGGIFYFLEINARLQVEHPITEELYGADLVEWQLRIAAGEALPKTITPPDNAPKWAMEARICAENPMHNLMPSAGMITNMQLPKMPGVRTDSGIGKGERIGGEYDSMLAKIIASGKNREQTRQRLARALAKTRIDGIATNTAFIAALAESRTFAKGATMTTSAGALYDNALVVYQMRRRRAVFLAAAYLAMTAPCPVAGFRLNDNFRRAFVVLRDDDGYYQCRLQMHNDQCRIMDNDNDGAMILNNCRISNGGIDARILKDGGGGNGEKGGNGENIRAEIDGKIAANSINVFCGGISILLHIGAPPSADDNTTAASGGIVIAPMPGIIREVMTKSGDAVSGGDVIIVMEAMKMDMTIDAPRDGIITMECSAGDTIAAGALLAKISNDGGS